MLSPRTICVPEFGSRQKIPLAWLKVEMPALAPQP